MFGPRSSSPRRLWSWLVASGEHRAAVADDHEARLLAVEELLDDDAAAARRGVAEHRLDGGVRFVARRRDDDALARGQAVGLDDDRQRRRVDVAMRGGGIVEDVVGRGRDRMALHERLGERLRALELGGGLRRPEDAQAAGAKDVDRAGGERRFRADDGEVDLLVERRTGRARRGR